MGRNRIHVSSLETGYGTGGWSGGWHRAYRCEWAIVVGDRVRRLRQQRGLTLVELASRLRRPDDPERPYSAGYLSRLERGFASPPLYVYIALADALDIDPGPLLGPDEAFREVSAAEMTLLGALREAGIGPAQAIARLFGLRP